MANISKIKVGDTSYGITATPTAHDSTATTYGAASASNYGHVKLSDNYTSSAGAAASGIGASSLAVYNAYNTLNSNINNDLSWKLHGHFAGKNSAGGYPLPTSFKELYIAIFDEYSNRTYNVNASYHHIATMIDEYNAEYNLTFGFASTLDNTIGWYAGGSIRLTKTTVNLMDYSFRGVDHSGDVTWLIYYK